MIKNILERINDFYECEIDITIENQPFNKKAIVEVRLYERLDGAEESLPAARELINIYSKEVKKPPVVIAMLGSSWEDEILLTEQSLKKQAVRRAIELWSRKILPIQINELKLGTILE